MAYNDDTGEILAGSVPKSEFEDLRRLISPFLLMGHLEIPENRHGSRGDDGHQSS
jgi:hypothetical protein